MGTAFASKAPDAQSSITVFPFANMSRAEDNEYSSGGLAEEIINVLAQIPGLRVMGLLESSHWPVLARMMNLPAAR